MTAKHIRKLEALQKMRKSIQEKEDQIRKEVICELSTCLMDAHALEIDFDTLMGGILEVIDKAKRDPEKTEAWKVAGQKFHQHTRKRKASNTPSKSKKAA